MEFYDVLSNYYEDIFPLDNSVRQFALSFGINQSDKILDVGCATGEFVYFLSQFANTVYGIDNNPQMIKKALMSRKGISLKNTNYFEASITDIDKIFKDERFNYIFCFGNTLAHINKKSVSEFLLKSAFLLEKGGSIVFQILNYDRIVALKQDQFSVIENDKIKFERFYFFNTDNTVKFTAKTTIKSTNISYSSSLIIYPLFFNDILEIFKDLPFTTKEIAGGLDLQKHSLNSTTTIGVLSGRL